MGPNNGGAFEKRLPTINFPQIGAQRSSKDAINWIKKMKKDG